jgi:hypothetical protein
MNREDDSDVPDEGSVKPAWPSQKSATMSCYMVLHHQEEGFGSQNSDVKSRHEIMLTQPRTSTVELETMD